MRPGRELSLLRLFCSRPEDAFLLDEVVEEEEDVTADPDDVFVTGTVVGEVDETVADETVTTVAETAEDTEPAQKPAYYKNNYKKNNYKKN